MLSIGDVNDDHPGDFAVINDSAVQKPMNVAGASSSPKQVGQAISNSTTKH